MKTHVLAIAAALGLAAGPVAAGPATFDALLDRLPADSDLVLVADLSQAGKVFNATLDRLNKTPLVTENPELAKLLSEQRAQLETELTAFKDKLGFDPFHDLQQIAAGVRLRQAGQPSLVAVVTGKFPDGLMAKLAEGKAPRTVGAHEAYPLEDDLWVVQLDGSLVVATEEQLEPALSGGGAAAIKERHPTLGVAAGESFLLALAFTLPDWLRGLAADEDLRLVRTLLGSLRRVELQVAGDLTIGLECADAAGADRAELALKGYRELLVGGAHLWRAYALFVLGIDLSALPALPPQVQAALANRAALRKTIDELLPSPEDKPVVARKDNRVVLTAPPAMLEGSAFVMGVMAAVAIPAFIEYIRKSKRAEVYEQLDRCYRSTVDYYDRPRTRPDGTTVSNELPPSMAAPACPSGRTIATLDGTSWPFAPEAFQPGGPAEVMGLVRWTIDEPTFGCFQLTVDTPGAAPQDGQGFTCHAFTDIDDDGKPAHYIKRVTFSSAAGAFRASFTQQARDSDDY